MMGGGGLHSRGHMALLPWCLVRTSRSGLCGDEPAVFMHIHRYCSVFE